MSDMIERLNAALEGRYQIDCEVGELPPVAAVPDTEDPIASVVGDQQ